MLGLISPLPPHGQDTRRCRLSHPEEASAPGARWGLMLALGSLIVKTGMLSSGRRKDTASTQQDSSVSER